LPINIFDEGKEYAINIIFNNTIFVIECIPLTIKPLALEGLDFTEVAFYRFYNLITCFVYLIWAEVMEMI
jgi:hypothetical protein